MVHTDKDKHGNAAAAFSSHCMHAYLVGLQQLTDRALPCDRLMDSAAGTMQDKKYADAAKHPAAHHAWGILSIPDYGAALVQMLHIRVVASSTDALRSPVAA